ncbi:MAG TPA: hypothetical protein VNE22_00420 [Acidimicrobiales bacterium]|nr:hypothetical protein [Acidimicrobiales bacterium]
MLVLSIFGGVLVVAIIAVAIALKRRRFESGALGESDARMSIRRPTRDMIPTPEEVTREAAERTHEYDAQDDQLDPHHGEDPSGAKKPEVP